ncbi:holin [Microbulbifer celer]|uniref:Holin n=1 Tax=Microbulbifer celer TaxID=435905 RepID=A0ABW3U6C8_9GAMM|nr:holin [Microbulbifer celer]UFN58572.1 hypothetical protein LPW13_05885 [Microbulbifer celer]
MVSPVEALIHKLSTAIAFFGGLASAVFAELQDLVAANAAVVVSITALAINWYYQRRRDRRDQIRFEQEMEQ